MKQLLALAFLLIIGGTQLCAKDYIVTSPDGKNTVRVSDDLILQVSHNGKNAVSVKADLAFGFSQGKCGQATAKNQTPLRVK